MKRKPGPSGRAACLERDIVVGDNTAAAAVLAGRGRGALHGAGAFAAALTAAEQHHVAGADFGSLSFVAILVVPFPGLETPFDVDETALGEVLIADFGQPVPHHNVVPLGAFLLFAGILVGPAFIGRDGKTAE